MSRTWFVGAGVAALLAVMLVGCQQPQMSLEEMMKPPQRPAELDKLDMLVGRWEDTLEMKTPGSDKVMTGKGVDTVSWEADKWLLVERFEGTMGDEGKFAGLGVWTWDPQIKKYRMWWFDNHGCTETGTATYDEASRTWHFKSKARRPITGETYVGEGTLNMVDNNTQEWNWTEWDCCKLRKQVEMKGTSRRK